MKNIIITLLLLVSAFIAEAKEPQYVLNNNTFSEIKTKSESIKTDFIWEDKKGEKYPIYISSKGKAYIIKISKKGNKYKKYLGTKVSEEILKSDRLFIPK